MKTISKILIFGTLFISTSCVTLYKPNTIHSPMLKEKGDFNATAALGSFDCGAINTQVSYAVADHVGLMLDGMYHFETSNENDTSANKLRIMSLETGAGYFTKLGNSNKWLFQCYNGLGMGKSKDGIDYKVQTDPKITAKFFNAFIQPGVAMTTDHFDLSFDFRLNYVRLYDIYGSKYNEFEWWNSDLVFHEDTTLQFVNFEPTVTMRAGGRNIKGFMQLGLTIPVVNSDNYAMVNSSSVFLFSLVKFSFGITYTFRRKKPQPL